MSAVRQEILSIIETLPERSLYAIKPLLTFLNDDDYEPIIETDLTDEERAILEAGMLEFDQHPENFVTLKSLKESIRGSRGHGGKEAG